MTASELKAPFIVTRMVLHYPVKRHISAARVAAWAIWKNTLRMTWKELNATHIEHMPELQRMLTDGVLIADDRYVRVSQGNPHWQRGEE